MKRFKGKRVMKKSTERIIMAMLVIVLAFHCINSNIAECSAAAKSPDKITLNAKKKSITVGKTCRLKVKSAKPSNTNKSVIWKSSNKKIAIVNKQGKVKAKKPGTVKITAQSTGNKKAKASCVIKVYAKVKKITISRKFMELTEGQTAVLKATVAPKKAEKAFVWSSSNKNIVTVNKKGKITAKKAGRAVITVKSKANTKKKAQCKVLVKAKNKGENDPLVTNTPEISITVEPTVTPSPMITQPTSVITKEPTNIPTTTPIPTVTSLPTITKEPTSGPMVSPSVTPKATIAPTVTLSPTVIPSPTVPQSPTVTPSPTLTPSPTVTPSPTATPSPTITPTPIDISNPRVDENNNVTYDCIYFGNYPQSDVTGEKKEPIKWRVLSVNGNDAFLLADKNLGIMPYNIIKMDISWEECTLRSWLNGYGTDSNRNEIDYTLHNFIDQAFTVSEQSAILSTNIVNGENTEYKYGAENDTEDKIFILSAEEASNAEYGFLSYKDDSNELIADKARKHENTDYVQGMSSKVSGKWWLRTRGGIMHEAVYVSEQGKLDMGGEDVDAWQYAVCPALHLNLLSPEWKKADSISIERE